MLMADNYLIQNSKIFYLFNDMPLEDGILDMEELAEIKDSSKDEAKKYV